MQILTFCTWYRVKYSSTIEISRLLRITHIYASLSCRLTDPIFIVIASLYTELGIFGFSTPYHGQ